MNKFSRYKTLIPLLLLIAAAVFLFVSRDYLLDSYSYGSNSGDETTYQIAGDHLAEQEFTPQFSHITSLELGTTLDGTKNTDSSILVRILDENGEIAGECTMAVSSMKMRGGSNTFPVDAYVKAGSSCRIQIQVLDSEESDKISLRLVSDAAPFYESFYLDEEAQAGHLVCTFNYEYFSMSACKTLIFFLVAAALFIIAAFFLRIFSREKDNAICSAILKAFSRILWLLTPVAMYFIFLKINSYSLSRFLKALISEKGLINLFVLALFWWLIYCLTNRTKYSAIISIALALIFGLANYFVLEFRGEPISFADFFSLGTAAEVAGGYQYSLNLDTVYAIIFAIAYISCLLALPSVKGLKLRYRILPLGILAVLVTGYVHLFFTTDFMKEHGYKLGKFNLVSSYMNNGLPLSLSLSASYYVVRAPQGYSASQIEELAKAYPSDEAQSASDSEEAPNIIVIMDEAFADLYEDGDFSTSEDYMPFFHSLTENTVKGNLYVSVLGGSTANTEFEFLTGVSMDFMPHQSIPYNSYINSELPSFTQTLKEQDYGGLIAFHPFKAAGWKRDTVYPNLGFDTFISIEDMEDPQYERCFVSDQCDMETIIKQYEEYCESGSDEPFYLFNVTIQNHSGYTPEDGGTIESVITITDEKQQNVSAEGYINLIKKSDDALQELVEYFQSVDEPTLIVYFGDHQPGLPKKFWKALFGKSPSDFNLEESVRRYQVPYLIWANYDIEEKEVDMSANYLGAYVMDLAGNALTGYEKYLLELREEIPVISSVCYIGDDGVLHKASEESQYSDKLLEYEQIQYNLMFDKKNRVEEFFHLQNS